jgi:hypothetical protein
MAGEPIEEPEDEDRAAERDRDRETTGTWDRSWVAPPAARHIEHPEPMREVPDQRGRYRGKRERKDR